MTYPRTFEELRLHPHDTPFYFGLGFIKVKLRSLYRRIERLYAELPR